MQRQEHTRGNSRDKVKKLFALFIVVLVVAGLVGALVPRPGAITTTPQEIGEIPALSATDHARGKLDSATVFIEYGDFQCPACGVYYPLVKQLEKEYGDRVKFVMRHFPLTEVHPNALPAAYASEAASAQGKFWEMHDMLFEHQKDWDTSANAKTIFLSYAKNLGLDTAKFESDMSSSAVADFVAGQQSGGNLAGIDSTPTFFLNGRKIPNPRSYDEFKAAIEVVLPK